MPATRSGRRAASARANTPPRLWPMIDDALAVALGEALEPRLEPRAGLLGAVDVGADAGAARVVAGCAQPAGHRRRASRRRPGSRGSAAPRGRSPSGTPGAAEDRAAAQRGRLEAEARLAPQRRDTRECREMGRIDAGVRTRRVRADTHKSSARRDEPDASARRGSIATMRAATIRDGSIVVEEHPDPGPQAAQSCSSASAPPASTAPT